MERYLVFLGCETLNPSSQFGWKRFHKDFATIDEATDFVLKSNASWVQVVDTKHNEIVLEKERDEKL